MQKGGAQMETLEFKSVVYTESKSLAACVTGGGGCACDDGTGE